MKRLVNIENPSIIITAPDELINEVGGNCYQIGGSQPLTYAKNLWRLEEHNVPKDIDKAAEEFAYTNWESDDYHTGASEGLPFDAIGHTEKCFKAGAEWMAEQGETVEGYIAGTNKVAAVLAIPRKEHNKGDKVIVQIRKK